MTNLTKWIVAFFVAILLFILGFFLGRLFDLMTGREGFWFLTPIAIIVFVLAVISARHHIIK